MPKRKVEGWESVCGKTFRNRRTKEEHQVSCDSCKVKREQKKLEQSKNYSRCGEKFLTKSEITIHQRTCARCRQLAWKKTPKTYSTRCGVEFHLQRERDEHLRFCPICTDIKKQNIQLRMEILNKENLSPERKKIFSETAKKTAQRPEIIAQRANNLKKWREANPEKFAKITEAAWKSPKKSRMENWLREQLKWNSERIRCGEERKQVDFVKDKIWIEVDGFYHFFEHSSNSENQFRLLKVQKRDKMLNEECVKRGDEIGRAHV